MDAFKTLSLPRQAGLDDGTLQRAYAEQSRAAHPDHAGSEQLAAQVNEAYQILRAPDKRLKHLLEIAAPEDAKTWRTVPLDEEMMSVFMALGSALEASGKFLEKKGKAGSALAKALLTNEELMHRETLESLGYTLADLLKRLESRLPTLDEGLSQADDTLWRELAALQARFAYVSKWQTQLRERLLALM